MTVPTSPGKLLVGQVVVVFTIVIGTVCYATQWTAGQLGHQPRLGAPWFTVGEYPVYLPWRLFEWWYAYEAYASRVFNQAGFMAAMGGIAGAVAAFAGSLWRARQGRRSTTYGSSRWAKYSDLRRIGLLNSRGVFLGLFKDRYLRHDGPEHVICFAPTRSGKGVGLVIPTLLTWPQSAVIHDIKGENWQLTSGWRARFLDL